MATLPTELPTTPLRQRMLDDMAMRAMKARTQHDYVCYLLEQDVDIRVIQVLLGHSKLETTALYTRVATRTIRAVTGPLDQLMALMEGRTPAG